MQCKALTINWPALSQSQWNNFLSHIIRNIAAENILPAVIFDVTVVTGTSVAFVGSEIAETSRGETFDCKKRTYD